ncbi:MAG: glycosyltransferase [Desulfamplus sp.]|nr:glycosyltransferase [Desulfamplus sp.]
MKVLVLDIQPIDPPIGGGRIRLLGLYHDLGSDFQTTYLGSYDWPGEKLRDHMLSETLREIDIPLSDSYFEKIEELRKKSGGKNFVDVLFSKYGVLSAEYLNRAKELIPQHEVIVFSHPWVYPLVQNCLNRRKQLIVHDSQNVESYLRCALIDDGDGLGAEAVREVVTAEHAACYGSDITLACSQEDRLMYERIFDLNPGIVKIFPNGVMTNFVSPFSDRQKSDCRKRYQIQTDKFVAIFIGSGYGPNFDAGSFIVKKMAPSLSEIIFVIAGGVGENLASKKLPNNVIVTGSITEEEKVDWLGLSDVAINPMFSGSGTNIKMFDFLAAGLAVVTTKTGARGISETIPPSFLVVENDQIISTVSQLATDRKRVSQLGKAGRKFVEEKFSWERISRQLGLLFKNYRKCRQQNQTTVIIPTYERHDLLENLLNSLEKQTYRDFEVVVVDQSKEVWNGNPNKYSFHVLYTHTDIKGAVKARNLGALYAGGEILAFTDDDCQPNKDWLANGTNYFSDPDLLLVEGLIWSDHMNNPDYRTVSNVGFEGIGFMTANLFVRQSIFNKLDGFDERFDNPHFREDTDFGWRVQTLGKTIYAHDVKVYHPPHKRDIQRESLNERNTFFVKDALLYKKHPDKYIELVKKEQHYCKTEGFWKYFEKGCEIYNLKEETVIKLKDWCVKLKKQ